MERIQHANVPHPDLLAGQNQIDQHLGPNAREGRLGLNRGQMVLSYEILNFVKASENVEVSTDQKGSRALLEEVGHLQQLFFPQAGAKGQVDHKQADSLDDEFLDEFFAATLKIMGLHTSLNPTEDCVMLFAEGGEKAQKRFWPVFGGRPEKGKGQFLRNGLHLGPKAIPEGADVRFQQADDVGVLLFQKFDQVLKRFSGSPNQIAPKIGEIAQKRALEAGAVGDVVDENFHPWDGE